jgi:phage baseplate assembly protein W
MAEIPHFASPFRIVAGSVATVEQDSDEDILGCVQVILRTDAGFRDEVPEFGVEELAFNQSDSVESDVIDAVRDWEPRVAASATAEEIEDMIMSVEVPLG